MRIKVDKEREVRDTICKQLVESKRTIGMYKKQWRVPGCDTIRAEIKTTCSLRFV